MKYCFVYLRCNYVTMYNKDKYKMDKKVKIKEIFLKLNPSGKDDVRKKISEKFNISVDTAKNHWIYNGNTPERNINEVLEILEIEGRKQSDELLQLIDVL